MSLRASDGFVCEGSIKSVCHTAASNPALPCTSPANSPSSSLKSDSRCSHGMEDGVEQSRAPSSLSAAGPHCDGNTLQARNHPPKAYFFEASSPLDDLRTQEDDFNCRGGPWRDSHISYSAVLALKEITTESLWARGQMVPQYVIDACCHFPLVLKIAMNKDFLNRVCVALQAWENAAPYQRHQMEVAPTMAMQIREQVIADLASKDPATMTFLFLNNFETPSVGTLEGDEMHRGLLHATSSFKLTPGQKESIQEAWNLYCQRISIITREMVNKRTELAALELYGGTDDTAAGDGTHRTDSSEEEGRKRWESDAVLIRNQIDALEKHRSLMAYALLQRSVMGKLNWMQTARCWLAVDPVRLDARQLCGILLGTCHCTYCQGIRNV